MLFSLRFVFCLFFVEARVEIFEVSADADVRDNTVTEVNLQELGEAVIEDAVFRACPKTIPGLQEIAHVRKKNLAFSTAHKRFNDATLRYNQALTAHQVAKKQFDAEKNAEDAKLSAKIARDEQALAAEQGSLVTEDFHQPKALT